MTKYGKSEKHVRDGSKFIAGGVSSNFRYGTPPNPLVFQTAKKAILTDIDGNEYIDYYLGMGAMLLGHSPSSVIKATRAQLDKSILVAGQTDLEYEGAELLTKLVPSAELVRFASSGTEAIQAALRIARAHTGRMKIVKFEGHYHGWTDNTFISVAPDISKAGNINSPVPIAGGMGQELTENTVVLSWNDKDSLTKLLKQRQVAAVITEPIMFNNGGIMPSAGYLELLRKITKETGTILIFDEVITGFRVSSGGAQKLLAITPDLTILGKALANGFPVAAVVGKRELFDLVISGKVLHGGTYNSQSVSMAATVATLKEIRSGEPYKKINALAKILKSGLKEELDKSKIPHEIVGYSAVFQVRFCEETPIDYRNDQKTNKALYQKFAGLMLESGIRILPRGTWFLSSAHTKSQIEVTLKAVKMNLSKL
jgi:glutamate-1-semialdehyde 2,1-aminomutase